MLEVLLSASNSMQNCVVVHFMVVFKSKISLKLGGGTGDFDSPCLIMFKVV